MVTSACIYQEHAHVQVAWHPGCSVSWLQSPYCDQECGRCSANTGCIDAPPDSTYTCAQQVRLLAEGASRSPRSTLSFSLDEVQRCSCPQQSMQRCPQLAMRNHVHLLPRDVVLGKKRMPGCRFSGASATSHGCRAIATRAVDAAPHPAQTALLLAVPTHALSRSASSLGPASCSSCTVEPSAWRHIFPYDEHPRRLQVETMSAC